MHPESNPHALIFEVANEDKPEFYGYQVITERLRADSARLAQEHEARLASERARRDAIDSAVAADALTPEQAAQAHDAERRARIAAMPWSAETVRRRIRGGAH